MEESIITKMDKMMWHEALEKLDSMNGGKVLYWAWPADDEYPGRFLARGTDGSGVIQFGDRSTAFGTWDGVRGTDGALLTLQNGDVYNEAGGLVSKGRS